MISSRSQFLILVVLSVSLLSLVFVFQRLLVDPCESNCAECPVIPPMPSNMNQIEHPLLISAGGDVLNNPFVDLLTGYYNGTRSFKNVCAVATAKRIELKVMNSNQIQNINIGDNADIVYYPSEHFIIRDVCALGHFPKELTHLFTHIWQRVQEIAVIPSKRAAFVAEYDRKMSTRKREKDTDDLEKIYYILAPQIAQHVIIGNACVTRYPPGTPEAHYRGDKYTNVFHSVMVHWISAIMFPWLDKNKNEEWEILTYQNQLDHPPRLGENKRKQNGMFLSSISLYEDYLPRQRTSTVCFETIYEREERWRWFPNFEVAHRFRLLLWRYFSPIKTKQRSRIHHLLTVPFPKQNKPNVLILRRDEDRHFNEKQTAEFLRAKFGSVANIKMVQYDRGAGHQPPSYYEQVQELAAADILVAAHGAALSSIMFMRPGSVVVELFPHNFRYYMYEELAKVMGIEYIAYEGERVSPPGCCSGQNWESAKEPSQPFHDLTDQASDFDDPFDRNYSSNGHNYVQLPRAERFKLIGKIYDLHGSRSCKKCDIEVSKSMWFEIMKNALASIWLSNSRLSNLHDFDLRR